MNGGPYGTILVVYALRQWPLRSSVRDHLYSFERYGEARAFPINLLVRPVPRWVRAIDFDAIVFHTTFLSAMRWGGERMRDLLLHRAEALAGVNARRLALPQDEFVKANDLVEAVNRLRIDHVLSVAAASEWPKIYDGVSPRVRFSRVLTGYLDPGTVARIDRIVEDQPDRPIDVGYRAWKAAPWLGRHGRLKVEVADAFARVAEERGLRVDVSTHEDDTLFGDDWFRFLARCKYTIGVEGGASILDRDGSLPARTSEYLAANPGASFEEVEAACFPGEDGKLDLRAVSPRHLEACASRTCQVLVAGDYNGLLEPGRHFIELERDLSNLDAVLDTIARDDRRADVTRVAYEELVSKDGVSYPRFVAVVEEAAGIGGSSEGRAGLGALYAAARLLDRLDWLRIAIGARVWSPLLGRLLPMLGRVRERVKESSGR